MILLSLAPNPNFAVFVNLDVNDVGIAADRAILDVFLTRSRLRIDRHDNLFAEIVTDVGGFFLHVLLFHSFDDAHFRVRCNDP